MLRYAVPSLALKDFPPPHPAVGVAGEMIAVGFSAQRPVNLKLVLLLALVGVLGANYTLAAGETPPPAELLAPQDPLPDGALARLGTLRFRQGGAVSTLAFAPDGKRLITAGGVRQPLRLWDLQSGKQLRQYGGQAEHVYRALCSSDGKFVVATEESNSWRDNALTQWDLATGKVLTQFKLAFHPCALALAADNRRLAVASRSGDVQVFDLDTGKAVQGWKTRENSAEFLAFSPDSKQLASGGHGGTARLWEVGSGELVREFVGPSHSVACGAFSPDGKMLALGSVRGPIGLWDVAAGKELARLTGHEKMILLLRFADAQTLISAGVDSTLRHWQVPAGKELRRETLRTIPDATALSPDGATLATGHGPTFQLWDTTAGKPRPSFMGHRSAVTDLMFLANGVDLVSVESDGVTRTWDTATGATRRQASPLPAARVHVLSAEGRLLAACKDKVVHITDLPSGQPVQALPIVESARRRTHLLVFSADAKRLASSSPFGPIQVHEVGSGKVLARFGDYPGNLPDRFGPVLRCPFSALVLAPDGRTLATAEEPYLTQATQIYDTKIRLWDIGAGTEFRHISHRDGVAALALSADGRFLVSAGYDKTIPIWEMATGRMRHVCKEAQGHITALALAGDSRTLAWGEESGRVVLFDVPSDKVVWAKPGHPRTVTTLRFSADGTRLASGSEDTTILLWDVRGRRPAIRRLPAPSAKELETLWADLLESDAAKAWATMTTLARSAEPPYHFLRQHLPPTPGVEPKRLAQVLANLQSDQFALRQQAEAALEKLGEQAEPELRKLVDSKPPLDTRQRVDKLLARIASRTYAPETLRGLRVVELLELLDTPEARQELERLSRGGAGARLTLEAQAALERLGKQAQDKKD